MVTGLHYIIDSGDKVKKLNCIANRARRRGVIL
jgi:hypothetical protein